MNVRVNLETLKHVEQFVYAEAALLDDWKTTDWLKLFTADCVYEVTPPGEEKPAELSSDRVYFLIADNHERLTARVERLDSPAAHAESPRSKVRHLYTNVRILEDDGTNIVVALNFHTFRNRNRQTFSYMGGILFNLRRSEHTFLIRAKRVMMDMDALIPQGKVSIFL